jgi:hypothetical protein
MSSLNYVSFFKNIIWRLIFQTTNQLSWQQKNLSSFGLKMKPLLNPIQKLYQNIIADKNIR